MNKGDEIREELSDLWCKEITGQLSWDEKIRLQNLMEEWDLLFPDHKYLLKRLHHKPEFDSVIAYRKFRQYRNRKRRRMFERIGFSVAATVLLFVGMWLLWNPQDRASTVPREAVKNEVVAPGKSKAMITLANGEKIVLGDKKQQLIEENGTLLNLDSTAVKYEENQKTIASVYNTIEIPIGGEYRLVLADGSKIWINAGSKLKFPVSFTTGQREVYLEGEAYFEVAKDSRHPFIVHTSRGTIEVLGTGFNVRGYREEQKVVTTLVQGKVVYRSEKQPDQEIVLEPGFQVNDQEGGILQPRKVDVILYTGWKDGKYVFENATLEEIMRVLSKWYDIAVFYKREEVKKLHFTGDLERYKTINDFLEFMEVGGNVRFCIKGKTVLIE